MSTNGQQPLVSSPAPAALEVRASGRSYEVVLLGATGRVGQLAAQRLGGRYPTLAWAVAGRSLERLGLLACGLASTGRCSLPSVEVVDTVDEDAVAALVARAKVVVSALSPFGPARDRIVRQCAIQGKHYVDCCPHYPWLAGVVERYDQLARQTGAMIIPACGFAGGAADLFTNALAKETRRLFRTWTADVHLNLSRLVCARDSKPETVMTERLFTAAAGTDDANVLATTAPYALSPVKPDAHDNFAPRVSARFLRAAGFGASAGGWHVGAGLDCAVVERSWGLLEAHQRENGDVCVFTYGPRFSVRSTARFESSAKKVWHTLRFQGVVSAALALYPRWGRLAVRRGAGPRTISIPLPSPESAESSPEVFELRGVAVADAVETDNATNGRSRESNKVVAKMIFHGDLTKFNALMLAEAAFLLAEGAEGTMAHRVAGVVPPSLLGQAFQRRLVAGGVQYEFSPFIGR